MKQACAVVIAVVAHHTSAEAAHPLVQLHIDPCVEVASAPVSHLITLELGAIMSEASDATEGRTGVEVSCVGNLVELRVDDPITGKALERTIDLQEAQAARPRLLALAIVELISASWTELETNPDPQVPPAGPRASPETRHAALATVRKQAEQSALRRYRLLAVASGTAFFSGPGLLGGAGLRLSRDHARHLGWMIELSAEHGSGRSSLGSIAVDLASVDAAFMVHQSWSRLALRFGVGLRGGAARLAGNPASPQAARGDSIWGFWGGPVIQAGVGLAATRRLALEAALEGGYVVVPVGALVAGRREVAVDGSLIAFRIGVGFFL